MLIFNNSEKNILNRYLYNSNDTGSTEIQIILISFKIKKLIAHVIKNIKDYSNKRGLLLLLNKKSKLLKYLKKVNKNNYFQLIEDLSKIS